MFAPAAGDLWTSPQAGPRAVLAPMPVAQARGGSKPIVLGKPRPEAVSAPPTLTPSVDPTGGAAAPDALSAVAALKKKMLGGNGNSNGVVNRGRDMQPRSVDGPGVATGRAHSLSPVGHRHVDAGGRGIAAPGGGPLSMSPQGPSGGMPHRQSTVGLPRLAGSDDAIAADSPVPILADESGGGGGGGRSASGGAVARGVAAGEEEVVSEGDIAAAAAVGVAGAEKGAAAGGKRRGRISVVVRKRPVADDHTDCIQIVSPAGVHVEATKQRVDLTEYVESHAYDFDGAFDEKSHNPEIYASCARPLIDVVFSGGSASCFAYGQTGSGKTHTMIGSDADPGIYILAAQDIFARLQPGQRLHVALYEIYCNSLFDLLNGRAVVIAREDSNKRVNICGLTWHEVTSVRQLVQTIENGTVQRRTGSTSANEFSSRSHAVVTLTLRDDNAPKFTGCLNIVDLAGSERAADTAANDRQTRLEGAEINKSLLALKECIRGLDERKKHIPFRGSKLTEVLRDSFVGMSKTVMIATISPALENVDHTLNTLRYAFRVKGLSIDVMQPSKERNAPRPAPQVMRSKSTDTPRQSLAAALAAGGLGAGGGGGRFEFQFGSPGGHGNGIGGAATMAGGGGGGGGNTSNDENGQSPTTDDFYEIDPESGRRRRSKREKVSSHRKHRKIVRTSSEMPPLIVEDRDRARVERAVMQVVETRITHEVGSLRQELADMRAEKANDRRTIAQLQEMNRLLLQRMEDLCRVAGVGAGSGSAVSGAGSAGGLSVGGPLSGSTALPTTVNNSVMMSASTLSMAPFTRPPAGTLAPMPQQQHAPTASTGASAAPLVALHGVAVTDSFGGGSPGIAAMPASSRPLAPMQLPAGGSGNQNGGVGGGVVVSGRGPMPSQSVFSSVPVLPPIDQHHHHHYHQTQQHQQPAPVPPAPMQYGTNSAASAASAASTGVASSAVLSAGSPHPMALHHPPAVQQLHQQRVTATTPRDDHAASTHQFTTYSAIVASVDALQQPRSRSANRRRSESTSSSPARLRGNGAISPLRR